MFTTRPAVGQFVRRRLHHQERSARVDGHETVEILQRGLRQPAPVGDSGVVDQHVYPSELTHHGIHHRGGRHRLGQVRLDRQRPAAKPADLGGHLLGLVLARVVGEPDVGSLRGQPAHDLRPYPAAASRDQRHLAS